jgi:hypothetical protein
MLQIKNLEYASDATVLFQRLSVCATSLVLVAAMLRATSTSRDSPAGLTLFVLVVANAGLIMVDNIHFQYNSILMGESLDTPANRSCRHQVLLCVSFGGACCVAPRVCTCSCEAQGARTSASATTAALEARRLSTTTRHHTAAQ